MVGPAAPIFIFPVYATVVHRILNPTDWRCWSHTSRETPREGKLLVQSDPFRVLARKHSARGVEGASEEVMPGTFVRKFYINGKQPPLEKALLTPVMGVAYIGSCTLLYIAAGVMRFTDGLVNVPVGLAMLASEKEPDTSLYDPVHGENAAVVAIHPSVASRQGRLGGVHLKARAM